MRPTIGTLSGAEQISQICRQSIRSPRTLWGRPPSAVLVERSSTGWCWRRLRAAELRSADSRGGCPHINLSLIFLSIPLPSILLLLSVPFLAYRPLLRALRELDRRFRRPCADRK